MEDNSENFEELKRLLKVKRHETPPPGFHDEMRSRILSQIEQEKQSGVADLWQRVAAAFELRPALSTGFAAALCGLLVAGVYLGSQSGDGAGADSSFAIDGQSEVVPGEVEIHNPFTATNDSLTVPPGIFDPQMGSGLQQVSETNVSTSGR